MFCKVKQQFLWYACNLFSDSIYIYILYNLKIQNFISVKLFILRHPSLMSIGKKYWSSPMHWHGFNMCFIMLSILCLIYSSSMLYSNKAYTVASHFYITFFYMIIFYNNILMKFKQINLSYTISYFSQYITIDQDFECTDQKVHLLSIFCIFP